MEARAEVVVVGIEDPHVTIHQDGESEDPPSKHGGHRRLLMFLVLLWLIACGSE